MLRALLFFILLPGLLSGHGTLHDAIAAARADLARVDTTEHRHRLAGLLIEHGDLDEARQVLAGVAKDKGPDTALLLARLADAANGSDEARRQLALCLHDQPENTDALRLLARIEDKSGQPEKAAAALAEVIHLTSKDTSADDFLQLATWQTAAGKSIDAIATLEAGRALHPAHPGLGEALVRQLFPSQPAEARALLATLREETPALAFRYWILESDLLAPSDPSASRAALANALAQLDERARRRPLPPALAELAEDLRARLEPSNKSSE